MEPGKPIYVVAALLILLIGTALPACAAPIIYGYDFTGTGFGVLGAKESVAFQLSVPDFSNPPLTIDPLQMTTVFFSCSQLKAATNCGIGIFFSNQRVLGAYSAQLYMVTSNNSGYTFFFPTDAFISGGVYTSGGPNRNTGQLRVTPVYPSPEPVASLLMLGGIAAMVWVRRC